MGGDRPPVEPPVSVPSLADPAGLARFLRHHLLDEVIPFWTGQAIDPAGGINTCISDDGVLISREKWLWSQWRAVWVFGTLFRLIDPDPHYLQIARSIRDFVAQHGWDERQGGWVLALDGDGRVLRGYESIYTDAFAIGGCIALARAGDGDAMKLALRTADHLTQRLRQPHETLPHHPYPVDPGQRMHGIAMIFSLVFFELGALTGETKYQHLANELSDEIFGRFYRPRRDLILERMGADGMELPPPAGTAVVPGHVIEDMWFQIHIAHAAKNEARIQQCLHLLQRHLELGWDEPYGGLFLAIDADGHSPVGWSHSQCKIWWPHTEALYALALAHELCGQSWCVDWFDRMADYAFRTFKTPWGEWRQKLTRDGQPLEDLVALPVKDPFHLPRALIYTLRSLARRVDRRPFSMSDL